MKYFVSPKKACEILDIHINTLNNWVKLGKIESVKTIGGHHRYNVETILIDQTISKIKNIKRVCYVRVSTLGQKSDLIHQINYMRNKYPNYEIIKDIGSGINFNRRGLRKIIKYALDGTLRVLVIAHKDRLTRFGFDLIRDLIKEYSDGKIIIENKEEKNKTRHEEIVEDVLSILNVYTAKINGMRKYSKNK